MIVRRFAGCGVFVVVATVLVALAWSPRTSRAALFFEDDFSTYSDGNLVGQPPWSPAAGSQTLPIQVSGGKVIIPGNQTGDNQDALRLFGANFPPASGTNALFAAYHLSIQSSPAGTPSFLLALVDTLGGFSNMRVATQASGAGFVFGARVTGQAGDPFTFGSTVLSFNTTYNLVIEADMNAGTINDAIKLYVNPASNNINLETPYLVHNIGAAATDPTSLGALQISQFQNASTGITGATFEKVRVADDFANAANVPEPAVAAFGFVVVFGFGLAPRRRWPV